MRPPILIRISNAWDALRGRPCTHTVDAMSIELNVDTSKIEEGLARAKARLAEFEVANKLPAPRLMITTKDHLSQASFQALRDNFRLAAEQDKNLVIPNGMSVYQLIAGQWQSVDTADLTPMFRADNEADARAREDIEANTDAVIANIERSKARVTEIERQIDEANSCDG